MAVEGGHGHDDIASWIRSNGPSTSPWPNNGWRWPITQAALSLVERLKQFCRTQSPDHFAFDDAPQLTFADNIVGGVLVTLAV